jgi:pimeloyl-ACP methyl ester carboxylesterase
MNVGLPSAVLAAVAAAAVLSCGSGRGLQAVPGPPVLLVHGSGLDSTSWDALTGRLRSLGWPQEYLAAVDLSPNDGANERAAREQLQPAAIRLLETAAARARREGWDPPDKLAVVAHSMGAVSGRWLASRLMPESVAVFVAIAGANHGSRALCGLSGAGNEELCAATSGEVPVFAGLNGTATAPRDPTPFGPGQDPPGHPHEPPTGAACIAWFTIFIDPDEWIVPADSARLAGSGAGVALTAPADVQVVAPGEFRVTAAIRHDDLPSAPAVLSLVPTLLAAPVDCPTT